MSRIDPLKFQERHIAALIAHFDHLRDNYARLTDPRERTKQRKLSAAVLLQAPTGVGKTLIATEVAARFSALDDVVWFWFAPYATLIDQAVASLRRQAPQLKILDIQHQRTPDELASGALFVITWQTVATKSRESRLARVTGDAGLAVDDLIEHARAQGLRIGAVVDEAHHGFVKAREAYRFFAEVLQPDYALLMTATPRDTDVARFAEATGYRVDDAAAWVGITRHEGCEAGLLKLGVKSARFLTRDDDEAALVDFEEVALSECAAMHRHIKSVLAERGINLTPLMLVQVPNGGAALTKARDYLTGPLQFAPNAVKVHVSDEPDPNLQALAQDPTVEVLVFKMAIAMGFDAPRAFTLAALRGTRDPNFGIQVVGRILRMHPLLQRRPDLPPVLNHGYVFLANSEAQEGLIGAAAAINQLQARTADNVPTTLVTYTQGASFVQVVKTGQTAVLFPPSESPADAPNDADAGAATGAPKPGDAPPVPFTPPLFPDLTGDELTHGATPGPTPLVKGFALDAQARYDYPLKIQDLAPLMTEVMPDRPDDLEEQLASFIDFSRVLVDRHRSQTKLVKRTLDLFADTMTPDDEDIRASLSVAGIAQRARQIAFEYEDVDRRQFFQALRQRFRDTLESGGFEPPASEEDLTQQLELVLVRNPRLIRQAHKRCRASQITLQPVTLPAMRQSETPLEPARRNLYGIFPADLSPDERRFAELLDTAPEVIWWHRNPPRQPESVALYGWSDGAQGFFPDFLVAIQGRKIGDGVALVEFKGPHLQQYEKDKAGAAHLHYGRVFMVGAADRDDRELRLFRLAEGELADDGPFEAGRLRYE